MSPKFKNEAEIRKFGGGLATSRYAHLAGNASPPAQCSPRPPLKINIVQDPDDTLILRDVTLAMLLKYAPSLRKYLRDDVIALPASARIDVKGVQGVVDWMADVECGSSEHEFSKTTNLMDSISIHRVLVLFDLAEAKVLEQHLEKLMLAPLTFEQIREVWLDDYDDEDSICVNFIAQHIEQMRRQGQLSCELKEFLNSEPQLLQRVNFPFANEDHESWIARNSSNPPLNNCSERIGEPTKISAVSLQPSHPEVAISSITSLSERQTQSRCPAIRMVNPPGNTMLSTFGNGDSTGNKDIRDRLQPSFNFDNLHTGNELAVCGAPMFATIQHVEHTSTIYGATKPEESRQSGITSEQTILSCNSEPTASRRQDASHFSLPSIKTNGLPATSYSLVDLGTPRDARHPRTQTAFRTSTVLVDPFNGGPLFGFNGNNESLDTRESPWVATTNSDISHSRPTFTFGPGVDNVNPPSTPANGATQGLFESTTPLDTPPTNFRNMFGGVTNMAPLATNQSGIHEPSRRRIVVPKGTRGRQRG